MEAKYLVTNSSTAPICVVGRKRLEIPAQCFKLACSFTDDATAKSTIARLKRKYPLLKFEPLEVGTSAMPEKTFDSSPLTHPAPSAPEIALMDADTFAKKATVERTGSGWSAVVVEGVEKPWRVRLPADEPAENAVPLAFEQYIGGKE